MSKFALVAQEQKPKVEADDNPTHVECGNLLRKQADGRHYCRMCLKAGYLLGA
jgi:hypothetical protein